MRMGLGGFDGGSVMLRGCWGCESVGAREW